MRYRVFAEDGQIIGETDLNGLAQWRQENRIQDTDKVFDTVTDRTTTVAVILSHDIAVGLVSGGGPGLPPIAPPSSFGRKMGVTRPIRGKSAVGGIAIRVALALALAAFAPYGGLAVSVWTVLYAIRLFRERDPNRVRCLLWAVAGMIAIIIWTSVKVSNNLYQHYGLAPKPEETQNDEN